jgi:type I restriction enzyme S subunit
MEVKPGYKQTEVGVIPEDWDIRPCSELSERITVGIVIRPAQYYVRGGIPAFRSANIREDGINDDELVFISEKSNALLAKSQTRAGDVLTVRTGYPGTSAVVRPSHAGSNCIDILITRPSRALDSDYLAIWVNSAFGKEQVLRNQGGLAQKHFNVGDMRNLIVALPRLREQHAIATALSDAGGLLRGLDRLIAKKRDLKQAAMQKLLTGQIRLPGYAREWEDTTLGAIGECIIGLTYKPENVVPHGLLVLRSSNIQNGCLTFQDNVYVNLNGKSALIDESASGLTFGAFMSIYRTKHWRFVAHAFQSHDIQRQIRDNIGATINQITNKDMRALRLKLPPEDEQVAIALVLSEMDAELSSLQQVLAKVRGLKQGMTQELLTGKTRLVSPEGSHA